MKANTYLAFSNVQYFTFVPDTTDHHASCLNLILILCPEKLSAEVLPFFGTSDYLLINVKADAKLKSIP